jgi:1,4-alpha-glucan branching enzyme
MSHSKYKFGVPQKGKWRIILNTDSEKYWGSGETSITEYTSINKSVHGKVFSIEVDIPPLSVLILKNE